MNDIERVGYGSTHPITKAQKESRASGIDAPLPLSVHRFVGIPATW